MSVPVILVLYKYKMANIILSDPERSYIMRGIQENLRCDGRSCMDYRFIELETDLLPHCSGSAHIRLAHTDLLVGIKAELEAPDSKTPNQGRIEFFVDCSPNASPQFEGRGGESLALEITNILKQSYKNSKCLDFEKLCVIAGSQVWVLYVDIVVLECGGNLADAASIGVKAALYDLKIPSVSIKTDGESEPEIEVSDDPYDVMRIDATNLPCIVTLLRVGSRFVVDATPEEEVCSNTKLILAVSGKGSILLQKQLGSGSLHPESILEVLETGQELEVKLNKNLMEKLEIESKLTKINRGYLALHL